MNFSTVASSGTAYARPALIHNLTCNILFADSHVEAMNKDGLGAIYTPQIYNGSYVKVKACWIPDDAFNTETPWK
ncbi:hypothetical protein SDC9_103252 [bioreactor metagenome]|uniref:Uncharacterized protein n=1 Tax=bioreactor metagenome TaxID=1076179 RepID=A0A645AUK3_9ZZZZ